MSPLAETRHPIGVVAERTGLSPDVLRVWERRYGVVDPKRSPGGQRMYSDADVERLRLLHRATQGGHGISHVAALSRSRLEDLVRDIESSGANTPTSPVPDGDSQDAVEQAIRFTETLDPAGLEILLRRNFARYGLITFLDTIVSPFLRRVGDAWHSGTLSVAQEHLATALVQRVVSQTAPLPTDADGNPTLVVATLEGERHANGALMAAATAASAAWHVIYLGADLPAAEIADAVVRTRARAVGVSVVLTEKKAGVIARLRDLQKAIPADATLLVGGAGAKRLSPTFGKTGMVFIESMLELHHELGRIRSR